MRTSWIPSFVALGIVWGASFLLIELSLESFTPIGTAFLRGFLGAAVLLLIAAARKTALPNRLSDWGHIFIVALLLNAAPGFLFALGQQHVDSVLAGILNATTPIMTLIVIALLFRKQSVSWNQALGIAFGFAGVALVSGVLLGFGNNEPIGIVYILLATFCYGLSYPYANKYVIGRGFSNLSMATTQVLLSALMLAPFALVFGIAHQAPTESSIFGIVLLGFLGTGIAYIWNYRNIALAGSAIASTVTYITPLIAVILGYLFLDESLRWDQFLGAAIVLISSAMAQNKLVLIRRWTTD